LRSSEKQIFTKASPKREEKKNRKKAATYGKGEYSQCCMIRAGSLSSLS